MAIINKQQYKRLSIVLIIPLLILGFAFSAYYDETHKPIIFCNIDIDYCYEEIITKENEEDYDNNKVIYKNVYGVFYLDTDTSGDFIFGSFTKGYFLSLLPQKFLDVKADLLYNSSGYKYGVGDSVKENVSILFHQRECQFSIISTRIKNNISAYCPNISEYNIQFKFSSSDDAIKFDSIINDAKERAKIVNIKYIIIVVFILLLPLLIYFLLSFLIKYIVYGRTVT